MYKEKFYEKPRDVKINNSFFAYSGYGRAKGDVEPWSFAEDAREMENRRNRRRI
ncbi:hypothetical protein BSNK01_14780 [Bacillaceae bacterium]